MSIIQGLIGSMGAGLPRYYLSYSGLNNEGGTITLTVNWENARNINLYWTIASDSATADVDFTSNTGYSGSVNANGTGSQVVAYITSTADSTTEGIEYYIVKLGTYNGANDLDQQSININDTSTAPTVDFTIEWWQKMNSSQITTYPRLFDVGTYPSELPGLSFEPSALMVWGNNTRDQIPSYQYTDTYNTWTHWAIVRRNNTMYLYKNGTNMFNTNNLGTVAFNNSTTAMTIGTGSNAPFIGKVTDFHWIKGTAKYTQNFSPLMGPADAITNSKLLLNVANDNSKLTDNATGKTVTGYNNYSFDSDSPYTVAQPMTATLIGAGNALGVFTTHPAGWNLLNPGWTISRVGGGWSSTVVSWNGGNEVTAADNWLNDGADYTFTPPSSISHYTGATGNGQYFELQFNSSYTDLANVKSGWYATCGGYTGRVIIDTVLNGGVWRVNLMDGSGAPQDGTWVFTPPAVTGSLSFNNGYLQLNASADWAFDA